MGDEEGAEAAPVPLGLSLRASDARVVDAHRKTPLTVAHERSSS